MKDNNLFVLSNVDYIFPTHSSGEKLEKPIHKHHSLYFCQVAHIVKREMESAVKLYVKMKAKVKAGPSWGNLQDLDI